MRLPVVAGSFYPIDKVRLIETIETCYHHKFGKGQSPIKNGKYINLKAVIAPHAGYIYSGACASHVFYEISRNKTADTYVILGLSHYGFKTSLSDEDFITPLGRVNCNKELTQRIAKTADIEINNDTHLDEHSIEVLLPFLQHAKLKEKEKLKIVPLIIGKESIDRLESIATTLRMVFKEYKERIVIIVSSDFTHYGSDYAYAPNIDVKQLDDFAIRIITEKDKKNKAKELFQYYKKTGITICGIYPILLLLTLMDYDSVKLLKYYRSSEIYKTNHNGSVSYASIAFYNN